MKVLVLSDVHGNLPALEFVLRVEKSVDLVISLGDVVNYGPWSNECVDLMDSLDNKILIMGNHEEAFISGQYSGSNQIAKTFFETCYPGFTRKEKIVDYKKSYSFNDCYFVHTLNNDYIFPDTEIQISCNTFIGHSHRLFSKQINDYTLVNAGSVGQNRINIDELNYVLVDTENNSIDLVKKIFSADKLINEMRVQQYPETCINYILSKRHN